MAFNGSGTFSLVSGNPVVTGTTISSTWANNTLSDIATNGLTNCLTKDGQTTPTSNIGLGGYKITSLGAGTAATDAATLAQAQNGAANNVTAVSGVTTITGTITPAPTLAEGMIFGFTAVGANGATPTLNVSSTGANIIYWHGATCTSSMWGTADRIQVVYLATSQSTSSTTGYHIIGHSGFLPANLLRVKGSLAVGKGNGQVEILSPGADGSVLAASASASAGVAWVSADAYLGTPAANKVFAGPASGASASPSFRALVPADLSVTPITMSLAADVTCDATANYFQGPIIAQGTSGTWFVSGKVTLSATGNDRFYAKLWDGTTVIDSGGTVIYDATAPAGATIALSGYITSPAGSLRISVRDITGTAGKIVFNATGNSKDSTISAIRVG